MVTALKLQTLSSILFWLNFAFYVVFPKIHSGKANSVDPDQTAAPAPAGAV